MSIAAPYPPIILREAFVHSPAQLFKRLLDNVVWDERMRARKTASFGVAYNYSQISYPPSAIPDYLADINVSVGRELGFSPNNILLNFYPDGDASMGFHSDSAEELEQDTGVAILSLGSPRAMAFRPIANKDQVTAITLTAGSLLYLPLAMQAEWQHAIPRAVGAEPRISATFREIVK